MSESEQQALLRYIKEQARVADANSKEWKDAGDKVNAAYRAGMWYAYNDVRNRIGNEKPASSEPEAGKHYERQYNRNRNNK